MAGCDTREYGFASAGRIPSAARTLIRDVAGSRGRICPKHLELPADDTEET